MSIGKNNIQILGIMLTTSDYKLKFRFKSLKATLKCRSVSDSVSVMSKEFYMSIAKFTVPQCLHIL